MKNNKNTVTNTNIKYSTLYNECDIVESKISQTERNRKRERIKKILDHLKQNGFIKDYAEYKKGRKFEGITIFI
jgi:ribosomal protein S8